MLRHGGGYEYRPMDPRITHTVAANLADTKAITLARSKAGGSAFVRPEWVTASLAAGRLLPVARRNVTVWPRPLPSLPPSP